MSLRAFHLFFIFLSFLLAGGFAAWALVNEVSRALGLSCAALAVALLLYGVHFFRSTRKLIL